MGESKDHTKSTTTSDLAAPVRALYAAINKKDSEAFNDFTDENVEFIDFGLGVTAKGREEVKKYFKNWWTAFPEGGGEITDTIISGDLVVVEVVGEGQQTGRFELKDGGFEASNEELVFNFVKICRVRDEKIVSIHGYSDAWKVLEEAGKRKKAAA